MTARRKPSLPDDEVQQVADLALLAWENGLPRAHVDSLTGEWEFLAQRTPRAGLAMSRRTDPGSDKERTVRAFAGGAELGAHNHVRVMLAAMVNAMVNPA